MKKALKRKNIFYMIASLLLAFLVCIAYFLSILMNSVINSKWPYIDNGFQSGMVESSSNVVADKSFNEAIMNGANSYAHFSKLYSSNPTKIGSLVPQTLNDFNQYQSLEMASFDSGTDFIVAAGFNLLDSILGATVYTDSSVYRENNGTIFNSKYKDKHFLIVDDSSDAASISRNTISVRFESEYTGFAAGIAASIYATENQTYKVSSYGGMQFQSVFDWMSGYEQAINWFNYAILGYDLYGNKVNEEAYLFNSLYSEEPVHLINGYNISNSSITDNSLFIDYSNPTTQSAASLWYSNSFNIGDGTSITAKQLDAGSSVIFPVAGGQLIDTLNLISTSNQNSNKTPTLAIGVDMDAAKQYPSFSNEILGTATKNVQVAVFIGIWYIDEFINKYNFDLPDDAPNYELALEFIVSNPPDSSQIFEINGNEYEIHGWMEDDPSFTSRDYAAMTDEEVIDNYTNNKDPNIVYSNNLSYEEYGNQYPQNPETGVQYGSELVANYDNGGSDFVTSKYLNDSFEALRDDYVDLSGNTIVAEWNFNDFLNFAFSQNPLIEKYSNTFASPGLTPITMDLDVPWIPDWNIYSRI